MTVRVEFLGLARKYAGVEAIHATGVTLRAVLKDCARQLPGLDAVCRDGELKPTYLANVNGQRFTANLDHAIGLEDTILVLSADAGG